MLFDYGVPSPAFTSITRPWIPSEDKVLVKTDHTSPNSMGLCCLIMEFPRPTFTSITRPWIPSEDKVLVKTNHTSSNSMGLCCLIMGSQPTFTSITRPWIPSEDKVLVKTNHTSSNSMGLCCLIMEFSRPPFTSITRPSIPSEDKILVKTYQTAQTRWCCVVLLWSSYSHFPAPSSDHLHIHASFTVDREKAVTNETYGCENILSQSEQHLFGLLLKTNIETNTMRKAEGKYPLPLFCQRYRRWARLISRVGDVRPPANTRRAPRARVG
ncbi:hypothetical protein EVAR_99479_1 [Eumeta japonica]|uniref:Uncharacterized protein n=1 Tax=Eumeta variegata TaxID=151549 RepID=A0A4C1ZQM1_EUMVA|nr:hypothetical protein EVAR_99479_1 [Eumeta japonica]